MTRYDPGLTHPEATSAPSSWKVNAYTSLLCPSCIINSFCEATSHNLHVPSNDAEPRYDPEGWNATRPTRLVWPSRDASGCSLYGLVSILSTTWTNIRWRVVKTHPSRDQRLTLPSPPPVAKLRPSEPIPIVASGCHAAPPTLSEWPRLVDTAFRLGRSHSFASPVHDVVRTYFELGEKRSVDKGRSSPNWDPRLANVYRRQLWPCISWRMTADLEFLI